MEFSGLTSEVLRLLLAQNKLPITGTQEQPGSISPSLPLVTHTRSSDSFAVADKLPRSNRKEPAGSNVT